MLLKERTPRRTDRTVWTKFVSSAEDIWWLNLRISLEDGERIGQNQKTKTRT